MNTELKKLWPTDILTGTISDTTIVDKFITLSLQESSLLNRDPSQDNIFEDNTYYFFLEGAVIPAFDQWTTQVLCKSLTDFKIKKTKGWLSSTLNGMIAHNHSGAQLSAVFYLLVDDQDRVGETILFDPRTNANRSYDKDWSSYFEPYYVKPKTYNFIVFPSFIYHQVVGSTSNVRITLAVDLFI